MLGCKLHLLFVSLSLCCFIGTARNFIQRQNGNRLNFHSTQNIDDLVKNPTALNKDEASEITKLDNMNDVFLNPGVTSESQDLSQQGLDPSVAMQISKLDHNLDDILGPRAPNRPGTNAKLKGEILPGYGEQYNADGSISLSNSEWPEYQMKDTPPMASMQKQNLDSTPFGNNDNSPQVSPQAALNPNLLPGQKSDLGMGMGVGMGTGKSPMMPMMSGFVKDGNDEKTPDKALMNSAFEKPGIKSAGFRIPGEFSFKGESKSAQAAEDANFVKNFMSSKKSSTERRKTAKKEKL